MPGRKRKAARGGPGLAERIGRLAGELAAREEEALRPLGLGRSQVRQLSELLKAPRLSASELARRVDHAPQSVASSVAQLESRGWLRRAPHPVHRRLVELSVTPAGRRVLGRAQGVLARVEAASVVGFPVSRRRALVRLLGEWDTALAR